MYTVSFSQLHSGCVHLEEALPLSAVLLQALSPQQQLQICTFSVVYSLHHAIANTLSPYWIADSVDEITIK